ncbi:probable mitochondrial-processing peptidase subunit beta, mitochondrial isoform X1 [Camellia sinensis]|uniref:probable mitochondrial-processing peptidase subunit beta, mitochondrial isoform X1 n=1 Tax=Camellia sinensis TaxID=4442 RepID=UPI001035A386|nr:probable mitochondrial-processing peptidase subunit beta, mitochondrial isoform X1 [Camellia sinensis]
MFYPWGLCWFFICIFSSLDQPSTTAAALCIKARERDLTDSTVLRNMGEGLGHSLLAYRSALQGISKLQVNEASLFEDLNESWEVLAEPIQTVEGQTEEVIFDHLHATAFQHMPLGRTILGPPQNVRTITKDHFQKYISTRYTTSRMVIFASGV